MNKSLSVCFPGICNCIVYHNLKREEKAGVGRLFWRGIERSSAGIERRRGVIDRWSEDFEHERGLIERKRSSFEHERGNIERRRRVFDHENLINKAPASYRASYSRRQSASLSIKSIRLFIHQLIYLSATSKM